ncbi:MAG: YggS family pyridoxal phosphate-dependent enzyme [Caulobacteraceae bacterium]|nr:YggS family pyridoxal phosphate-dependent enzyme [Caulobacteraceae bacterium]
MSDLSAAIAANFDHVRRRIAKAAVAASREPGSVSLTAVTKQQPEAVVEAALACGQRVFGENRVQEAATRWASRRATDGLELRLIGPLQSNKTSDALALFDVIETVDRPKLARSIFDAVAAGARAPRVLVQVNTGEEPQKAGVFPADADRFIAFCREGCELNVEGVMCIPPVDEEPAMHFALLADIARRNRLQTLSMGMSGDYESAIRFGATHVRVGSALFGARG